jgi:putative ABC transport system substrate-binding protein
MNKKLIGVIAFVAALIAVIYLVNFRPGPRPGNSQEARGTAAAPWKVGVFQIVRHPALDDLAKGFRQVLDDSFPSGVEYDIQVADGDAGKIEAMANRFATGRYDLVYVIGTNCAQSLSRKAPTLPIVLGGATDPESAGLVKSWEQPGGMITGTSDLSPIGEQIDTLLVVMPKTKRIGVIYNAAEENSQIVVKRFDRECERRQLQPVHATISNENEVRQTVVSLAGKVDALYAPTDATIQAAFSPLIRTADELKLPVFDCDENSARAGAIFSIGSSYLDLGRTSGSMAVEILRDKRKPATIPIRLSDRTVLYYNQGAMKAHGLEVPEAWSKTGVRMDP